MIQRDLTPQELSAAIEREEADTAAALGTAETTMNMRRGRIKPLVRQTHTVATMMVSRATYAEVANHLRRAGYDHAFMEADQGDHPMLDMSGIALERYYPNEGELLPVESAPFIGHTEMPLHELQMVFMRAAHLLRSSRLASDHELGMKLLDFGRSLKGT